MGGAGVVVAPVVGDGGGVAVVGRVVGRVAVDGEGLGDVAPAVRALDWVGQVDVGGPGVDRLAGLLGQDGVGDDDLLARYQSVVGRRVKVKVRSLVDEGVRRELLHGAQLSVAAVSGLSNRCLSLQAVVHWLELSDLVWIDLIQTLGFLLHHRGGFHGVHGVLIFL